MTIAIKGTPGTTVYSQSNPAPTVPAHAAGDLLLCLIGTKPDTAAADPLPAGWTMLTAVSGGIGTTGADTGPMRASIWYKIATSSSETPGTIVVPNNSVTAAKVIVLSKATNREWAIVGTGAADTTGGTPNAATMPINPGLTVGDFLLALSVIPTDVTTPAQFTAETVAATGMTTVTLTEMEEWDSQTGNDMGGWIGTGTVVTGTSSAAPTVSATVAGTNTNVAGPILLVRLREVISPSDTSSISISERSSREILGQNNRLTNPSFENGQDWTRTLGTGTLQVVQTDAADGEWVLQVTPTSGGALTVQSPPVPYDPTRFSHVGAGATVRRVSGTGADTFRVFVRRYNAPGSSDSAVGTATTSNDGSWQRLTVSNTSLSSTQYMMVEVQFFNPSAGDVWEIDSAQVNELTSATVPAYDPTSAPPTINKSASDTASVAIADTSQSSLTLSITDAASLSIADVSATDIQLSATDTSSLAVADASSTSISQVVSTTDTASVSIADSSAIFKYMSASDTASISIADTSSSQSTLSRTDTASISVADVSASLVSLATSDTASVSVADTSSLDKSIAASDASALSVGESTVLQISTSVSASDTSSVAVTEAQSMDRFGSYSDTASVSATESRQLDAVSTRTDTASLSITESSSLVIDTTVSATDTGSVSIADASQSLSTLTRTDTVSIAIADASTTDKQIPTTDTSSIAITEVATVVRQFTATDTSSITITETTSNDIQGVIPKSASDAATIAIGDSSSLNIAEGKAGSDTASIAVTESVSMVKNIAATDTSAVVITESNQMSKTIATTDASSITVVEAIVPATRVIDKQSAASDTSSVAIAESVSIAVLVSRTDTSGLSVTESSQFAPVAISGADTSVVALSDTATADVEFSSTDTSSIDITEEAEAFGYVATIEISVSDESSLAIRDVASIHYPGEDNAVFVESDTEIVVTFIQSDDAAAMGTETNSRSVENFALDSENGIIVESGG